MHLLTKLAVRCRLRAIQAGRTIQVRSVRLLIGMIPKRRIDRDGVKVRCNWPDLAHLMRVHTHTLFATMYYELPYTVKPCRPDETTLLFTLAVRLLLWLRPPYTYICTCSFAASDTSVRSVLLDSNNGQLPRRIALHSCNADFCDHIYHIRVTGDEHVLFMPSSPLTIVSSHFLSLSVH
jgi:hypothetical protein